MANEYGKSPRQLSVRAKSTKENPGTLPISAYGRRMLGRNPLTSIEKMRQNIRAKENNPTNEEAEEEEHEDANDIQENFDRSADFCEAESNVVTVKDSVVLISQDDRVSGSFLFGTLAQNWRRRTMETVKAHVYSPDEEDCLLFHYEFTGLVNKENIVQEVAITSDMWS